MSIPSIIGVPAIINGKANPEYTKRWRNAHPLTPEQKARIIEKRKAYLKSEKGILYKERLRKRRNARRKSSTTPKIRHDNLSAKAVYSLGMSQKDLAKILGINETEISAFVQEKKPRNKRHATLLRQYLRSQGALGDEEIAPIQISEEEAFMIKTLSSNLSPFDILTNDEIAAALQDSISRLKENEKKVLRYRFFHKYTLEDTGKAMRKTRESIRQIQDRALRRLRHPSSPIMQLFDGIFQ